MTGAGRGQEGRRPPGPTGPRPRRHVPGRAEEPAVASVIHHTSATGGEKYADFRRVL